MNARIEALHTPVPPEPGLRQVALADKYTATSGEIYLSGIQALVRLPLMQRLRDQAAGLQTGGFVSGYRGSPLGGLDEALWQARPHLDAHHVRFVPGVNEELAATAVWGSQQVHLLGESDYDGVFGLWYGKGPGVDRSIDVFKHMNHAGTSRHGGVLLVAGDDHGAYSSTLPHQSDHVFAASMIPMLYPCNVQEYIELGLHGFAMSRFSGCAVGFKALADTVESSASISADPFALQTRLPAEFVLPEGGLNNRLSTDTLGVQARKQEALMQDHKIYAAMAYARENRLNRVTIDAAQARLGIVASGKSYLDVLEALEELGIDEALAGEIGIRLFKVAMPWPLEPEGIRAFARGLEEILVVDGKTTGIRLEGGEVIHARCVISNAHVQTTLLKLVGGEHLDASLKRQLRNLRIGNGMGMTIRCTADALPSYTALPMVDGQLSIERTDTPSAMPSYTPIVARKQISIRPAVMGDLALGVINITDEDPPLAQFALGYDPVVADPRGRVFSVGLTKRF